MRLLLPAILFSLITSTLLISGCGKKGNLVMPEQSAEKAFNLTTTQTIAAKH